MAEQAGGAMDELFAVADAVGERLRQRGETVAVAESSAGGLISAALLAVPGASSYFLGGGVVYTGSAKERLIGITQEDLSAGRAATETHALILANRVRERLSATWGIGETGAAGPTGNRYGDPAGHSCIAVAGPSERTATISTRLSERRANMPAFAIAALRLLLATLEPGQ